MSVRDQVRPLVAHVVRSVGLKDPRALRRALTKAYPFAKRKYWPYRVWLDEIKQQIGGMRPPRPDPRQLDLFDLEKELPK